MAEGRNNDVGQRISHFRLARGMSKSDLARRIGVAESRISEYEAGKHKPDLDKVTAIASALGVLPVVLTTDGHTRQFMAPEYASNPKPVTIDGITVPNLYVIVGDGREPIDIKIKYSHTELPLHPRIKPHFSRLSQLVEERARAQGAAYWNGPIVRLLRITEQGSHQHPSGYEKRGIELELAPVSWTQFSVLNTMLDEQGHFKTNSGLTMRELVNEDMLYSNPTDFSWCQLSNMLTICMMPVTKDGYGFIQKRSSTVSCAPGKFISGVSENMHRWLDEAPVNYLWSRVNPLKSPREVDRLVGSDYHPSVAHVPSPYLTVLRGIEEELGYLQPVFDSPQKRIHFTGIIFDLSLFQPVLVGVIDLPYTAAQFRDAVAEHRGKDHSEWLELLPVKLTVSDPDTRQRMQATHEWDLGGLAALIMSLKYVETKL